MAMEQKKLLHYYWNKRKNVINEKPYKNKKLLVIGAGTAQAEGIKRAKELGCHTIAVDGNPMSPGFKFADEYEAIDFSDAKKVLKLAEKKKIDAVMTFCCDAALHAVAEIVEKLALPGLTHEQVDRGLNKFNLRKICAENEIPVPFFAPAYSLEECQNACLSAGFPCVIKPMDSSGSRGVTLVNNKDEIEKSYNLARQYSKSGILIEAFMHGLESSVEGFVLKDGACVVTMSDKIRTPPPYLLDTDVIFPTKYTDPLLSETKNMALKIMNSMHLNPTPFHMEVMMTPDGPRIVEVGLRGPGFKVFTHIIPKVTGVDVLAANIAVSFGDSPKIEPKQVCASAIKFIAGKKGIVKSIHGVEEARAIPGIEEIEIYIKPGDETRDLCSGADRIGHILAYADSRDESANLANKAASLIKVEY